MTVLSAADDMYYGTQRIQRVMQGSSLVWQRPVASEGVRVVSIASGGSQGKSVTVTAPADIVEGNLLYAVAVLDDNQNPGTFASTGWTQHFTIRFTTNNNNGHLRGFWKVATGAEPASWVFTGTRTNACSVIIMQIGGADATDPFGSVTPTTKNAGNTSAPTFTSVTTTSAGKILLLAAQGGRYSGAVSTLFTPPTGYALEAASTSQANAGTNANDSNSVFAALSSDLLVPGTYTPGAGAMNVAFFSGTATVFLKSA